MCLISYEETGLNPISSLKNKIKKNKGIELWM